MSTEQAPPIEPETKDWTWVLERPCAECGYDASQISPDDIAGALRENAASFATVLSDVRATRRPEPTTWSPTEYACHVRDVNGVFAVRLEQMLTEDDPLFANWDQDRAAVEQRYVEQQPAAVVPELLAGAELAAGWYDRVSGADWDRAGRRSNGSTFTLASLGRYHLHDVVHHRWDIRWLEQP